MRGSWAAALPSNTGELAFRIDLSAADMVGNHEAQAQAAKATADGLICHAVGFGDGLKRGALAQHFASQRHVEFFARANTTLRIGVTSNKAAMETMPLHHAAPVCLAGRGPKMSGRSSCREIPVSLSTSRTRSAGTLPHCEIAP